MDYDGIDQNSDTESRRGDRFSDPESYSSHASFNRKLDDKGENLDRNSLSDNTGELDHEHDLSRDKDYSDWRSQSLEACHKDGDCRDNHYVTSKHCSNNLATRDDIFDSENCVTFENKSEKAKGNQSPNDLHTKRDSNKTEQKTKGSNGLHDISFKSSAEARGSYMSISGAAWPLAEGNCISYSARNNTLSLESNSFDYRTNSDSKLSLELPKENSEATKLIDDDDSDDEEEEKGFSFKTLTRQQMVILIATSFTNLLSFLSLSVLAPFFPIEADKKHVNSTISGWIFGIFALTQFLTSPLFGRLMPIVGSRFMYLAGLFVCGGCTLIFGVLDKVDASDGITRFVALCFVTRVLLALGCTGLSNAGFVMLVKAFPDSVATVFGIGEVFTGLGMVTGPALGGFLYTAGGFILPFAVIGGCCFLALPVIWFCIPPQDDSQTSQEDNLSLKAVVLHPRAIVNSIVVIVAASVWSVLDPTLEPHLRVYGLGPEMVGVLFLIMAAFYSVTSPIWGRLADKLPDNRTLLIPGLLLAAVGLLLAGPSPALGFDLSYNQLWLTIVSLMMLGLSSSMCVIPTYDIYIDVLVDLEYPEDTRTYGMVSGLWVSMYALGDFLGPTLGGFVFEEVGFEWMATGVAGACVLTSILVCVAWFVEKKCCRKMSRKSTVPEKYYTEENSEKTSLLTSHPVETDTTLDDALNTYPPGSLYNVSYNSTTSDCKIDN